MEISVNITILRIKIMLRKNNHISSYASLSSQTIILHVKANITFPINLHNETVSYFSLSSFGKKLNPAIKKEPFPVEKIIPSTMNKNIMIIVSIILFTSNYSPF